MLSGLWHSLVKKPRTRNFLLLLWEEMNTNLERYYVIDQRQFIHDGFETSAWEDAKHLSGEKFPQEVLDYALAVEEFNAALEDVRTFERQYLSDISHKTLENATCLHGKKEALEARVSRIQPLIISAQKALREMMDKASHA